MPPIDLDNIIPYDPSAKRPHLDTRHASSFGPPLFPDSIFRPVLSLLPPPAQEWPSGFAVPSHSFSPGSSVHLTGDPMRPAPLPKFAESVAAEGLYEPHRALPAEGLDQHDKPSASTMADVQGCSDGDLESNLREQHADEFHYVSQSQSIPTTSPEDLVNMDRKQALALTASNRTPALEADGPDFPVSVESTQSLSSTFTDSSIFEELSRQSTPDMDGPTTAIEESSVFPAEQSRPNSPSTLETNVHFLPGKVGIEPETRLAESSFCVAERSAVTGVCENPHPESQTGIGRETDGDAASGLRAGDEAEQQSSERNLSASPEPAQNTSSHHPPRVRQDSTIQRPCDQQDTGAESRSTSEPPSAVITNLRPQARQQEASVLSARSTSSNKKRVRRRAEYDGDSTDGCDDPNDADYTNEIQCMPRQPKRARSPMQVGPRRSQRSWHNPQHLSVDEPVLTGVAGDKKHPSSLSDIETIPVRGFLTRQILLSRVVYSVTFEEQAEHDCFCEFPDRVPSRRENEDVRLYDQPRQKASRPTPRSIKSLSEDDTLLIDLKNDKAYRGKRLRSAFLEGLKALFKSGIAHS